VQKNYEKVENKLIYISKKFQKNSKLVKKLVNAHR